MKGSDETSHISHSEGESHVYDSAKRGACQDPGSGVGSGDRDISGARDQAAARETAEESAELNHPGHQWSPIASRDAHGALPGTDEAGDLGDKQTLLWRASQ
jgi:hypothetical protein